MNCPVCGAYTYVLESRVRKDGNRWRRYECGNEHRFNTKETIERIDVTKPASGRYVRKSHEAQAAPSA